MNRAQIESIVSRVVDTALCAVDQCPPQNGYLSFKDAVDLLEMGMKENNGQPAPKRTKKQTEALEMEIEATHQLSIWPKKINDVKMLLLESELVGPELQLINAQYWQALSAWLSGSSMPVYLDASLKAYLAWHRSLPPSRTKKNHKQAFRNWVSRDLSRAEWKHGRDSSSQR